MALLSSMYIYVRSRQLEGSYDNDPSSGTWPISALRVMRGWGCPSEKLWPYVGDASLWPPKEEPADIDTYAKENRLFAYQRARSSNECKLALIAKCPVTTALEITSSWFNADNGKISMPRSSEKIIGSHCINLVGYDDMQNLFTFANSWGVKWGDKGYGYLPYKYIDAFLEEAWVALPHEDSSKPKQQSGFMEISWGIPSILHVSLHGIEIRDSASNDPQAWAFALSYDGCLNVEELFVMPKYRNQGHAKTLVKHLQQLSNKLSLPLRIWISHADSKNLPIIKNLINDNNLGLYNSQVRWASYLIEKGSTSLDGDRIARKAPGIVLSSNKP